ncbi:MAG: 30S ribosomal protein S12 methylthiotransferase RimO [Nitrospinota bacterium]|nr:30S ribosomal protein S12 methylthiotransferase RimO [Nitrospinota bacterium]
MTIAVYMTTLGCPKNRVDSEKTLWTLVRAGARITLNEEEADLLLVNTCGFVTDAKEESIERVLELAEVKKRRPQAKLAVMGCLSERYREELGERIPEIDHLYGVHELDKLARELAGGHEAGMFLDPETLTERTLTTPAGWAYLKVAEGCSNTCSFCAIPMIRGPYRSRAAADVLEEAARLAARGVVELNLVAQDTTLYGADLKQKNGLATLIRDLATIDGIEWIRIMYMYPPLLDDHLLETMASTDKVAPYFDIPLQHASDKVLGLMGRKETGRSIRELVARVRGAIPGAAIRSAFILGFPGETEEDFDRLMEFLEEARLDHVGGFVYSPEEGTSAVKLTGRPPEEVGEERLGRLMETQRDISRELTQGRIGMETDVLVQGLDSEENLVIGRAPWQAPEVDGCVILDSVEAAPGEIIRLKITGATDYDLIASAE